MTVAVAYEGRADNVWPPHLEGWAEVPMHHDDRVVARAKSLLGALPAYHYADEALPSGLYRFFTFETPIGEAVGALKFVGARRARMLLGGNLLLGGASQQVINAAAVAMNNALIAHGYVLSDQPLYIAFQTAYGGAAAADGFPGEDTMNQLQTVLAALTPPVAMANVPVYPWLATTASGATGQAAYDGTNAPTWAQWTGSGTPSPPTTPTPAPVAAASTTSGGGAAGIVAGIIALGVGAAVVIAKSAGVIG